MISFFRRALSSWIVLGLLGLIMIAFIITGIEQPALLGGAGSGGTVAKVDGSKIGTDELMRRIQNQYDAMRRERPELDRKEFLAAGGFEGVTDALIDARALDSWGRKQGFAISKRLVDAQIASMPAFRGITGQFDEAAMRERLAQARVTERELRADLSGELMRGQILTPVSALSGVPAKLARPYARLLLEVREGQVGILPIAAFADSKAPSEADIAAAYKADIANYTRPEARVLRYATFGLDQVAAQATPTEEEIAAHYREQAATYAARETRSLVQVIAPNEAAARTIATAAQSGKQLWAVAANAGLEATTLADQSKQDYAGAAGAAVADQAFAADKGALVGPVKGSFGWYVVRIEEVKRTAARPLAEVRSEIATLLARQKTQEALSDLAGKIEDAIADGSSFAEIVATHKLTVTETPPVLSDGKALDQPGWQAPPELAALLKTGFEASADDRATIEPIVRDERYALLSVARVIPPTPLPLAEVRDAVIRDITIRRATEKAKAAGQKIVAAVNRGTPLAKAITDLGLRLPPPQPARARQLDIAQAQQQGAQIPEPVRALFGLQPRKARLIPGDGGVLFIAALEKVIPGNLDAAPGLIDATRQELIRAAQGEIADQFVRSVRDDVDVKRYDDALAAAKRQFSSAQ